MSCQLCRIEGDDQADGPRTHVIHQGVDISTDRRDQIFAAMDRILDDMEQESLNLVLHRFQRLFAIKGNLVARSEQLYATGDPLADKRLNSEVRTALFQWLQAIRAYLDHTETRLKRRYGNDSSEVERFKRATNLLFDTFFAYRFIYKLRNAQHVGFSQISVVISESVEGDTTATVKFNRDALLEAFDEWGPVKEELRQFPDAFFIDEHVVTMMQCIDWLASEVADIERPPLATSAGIINSAIDEIPAGKGHPAVICLPDDPEATELKFRFLYPVETNSKPRPQIVGRPSGRGDDWITWDGTRLT